MANRAAPICTYRLDQFGGDAVIDVMPAPHASRPM